MTHTTATRQVTATITGLKRRQNTPDGNPRYLVYIENQTAPLKTADNIADGYILPNFGPDGSDAEASITLTLDDHDEITRVSR